MRGRSRAFPACARRAAEAPQLLRGSLVVVDEIVELERIDLATVKSREPFADAFEQLTQLLLVVFADDLARGAPPRALCQSTGVGAITAHGPHATPNSAIAAAHQLPVPTANRRAKGIM